MALDKKEIRKKYIDIEDFLKKEYDKHRCACSCNKIIQLKKSHYWNGIPKFIFGHAARLRAGTREYDRSKYFSVEDIADISNVSDQTVRLWNRSGKIKARKTIGRKNLYLKTEVIDFLENRPKRLPFIPEDYVTVQELKRMGVSRSKLRALVRNSRIQEPRHYSRKTHYLREEISQYLDQILEDPKQTKKRGRISKTAFIKLKSKVSRLEKRITALEKKSL